MERVRTARTGAAWAGWDSGDEEFVDEMERVLGPDSCVAQWGRWQRGGEVGPPPGLSFPLPPDWPAEEEKRPEAAPKAGRSSPPSPWDSSDDECMEAMTQAMGPPMCHAKKVPAMVSPAAFMEQQLAEGGNGGDDEGDKAIISDAAGDDGGGAFAAGAEGDGDCGDYGGDDGVDASVDAEGNPTVLIRHRRHDRVMLICECCPNLAIFRRADVTGDPENDDKLFCASCWETLQLWHPWARGWVLQQGKEIMAEDEAEQHKRRLTRRACSDDGDDEEISQQEKKQESDGKPQKANDAGSKETMVKGNPRCVMNDACVGYDQDDVVKVMPQEVERWTQSALMSATMYCIPCWREVRKRHDTKSMVAVLQARTN